MNQHNKNIQINLLYSIVTDQAQEFVLDKINFHFKNIQQLSIDSFDEKILNIKGLFGCQKDIEKEIKTEIHQEIDMTNFLKESEKGNLILIQYQDLRLFCLILPIKFFLSKPIQEKSIEIVLFRILHDFTDNIKLCLDDQIFSDWYSGDIVPFSARILERQDYDFREDVNLQVQNYQCQFHNIPQDISKHHIITSNSFQPYIILLKQKEMMNQEEFHQNLTKYVTFTESLMMQILVNQNNQIIWLLDLFQKEHQTQKLREILNGVSTQLNIKITEERKKLIQDLSKKLKSFFNFSKNDHYQHQAEKILINAFSKLKFQSHQFEFECEKDDHKKLIYQALTQILVALKDIQEKFRSKLKQIFQELTQQTTYFVERVIFKIYRQNENQADAILSIWPHLDEDQKFQLDTSIFKSQTQKLEIKEVFSTKQKGTIVVVQTEIEAYILFQQFQSPSFKIIRNLHPDHIKQAIYYYDHNLGYLYIFNYKVSSVQQIIISQTGAIQVDQQFCFQQDQQNQNFLIQQVAYISVQKKFLVLSDKNKILALFDKQQQFISFKCLEEIKVEQRKELKEADFIPSIESKHSYNQLLSCPSGKYFYLANHHCCDRYDYMGKRVECIKIRGQIKIFSDSSDVIILHECNNLTESKRITIIQNLIQQKKFNKQQNNEQIIIGNPALDIVKGSFVKFGPNSQFLSKHKSKNIQLNVESHHYNKIEKYYNNMNLNNVFLSSQQTQFSKCDSNQIKNIIYSRVPQQFCTIENGTLIPLNDGFRQQSMIQNGIKVDQKVKQLHLGFLEDYLSCEEQKIFVVGIIGKQSSGKSYLLNRIFGTRFSVSSARCTDGVWGTMAYVEDQKFLILDCEGLFNGARTEKEEIKMLAFLTAISDITILNSDSTFSRYQNELFNNLVEASKQLNDEKLFKGFLYIVIRDVSTSDNLGLEQELLKNLDRLKTADQEEIVFLNKLFNNKLSVEKMVNNENTLFDQQVKKVRDYIINQSLDSNRWKNGKELIAIVKIVLCQLELSDTSNASLINLQIRIEQIYFESQILWYQFSQNLPSNGELKLNQANYTFEMDDDEYLKQNTEFLQKLYTDLKLNDNILNHKSNLNEANSQFNKMMEQRKQFIIQHTLAEISDIQMVEMQTLIQKENTKLQDFLQLQIDKYQFCQIKCHECCLSCKHFKNHIQYSENLRNIIENEIELLEEQCKNSKIKSQEEEEMIRNSLIRIEKNIEEIENTLKQINNLIKYSTITDLQSSLIIQLKNGNYFKVESFEVNGIKLISENGIKQITKDIEGIYQEYDNIKRQLQSQNEQQANNKIEIENNQNQQQTFLRDSENIENNIKKVNIAKQQLQQKIEALTNQQNTIKYKIQQIQSEIDQINRNLNENELVQQADIDEYQNEKNQIQEELNQLQTRLLQNKTESNFFEQMSLSEFINYFNSQLDKKQAHSLELYKIKDRKKELQAQKDKYQQMMEEKKSLQQKSKVLNRKKIQELERELQDFDLLNLEKQAEFCSKEEQILMKTIYEDFYNLDLYNECHEKAEENELQLEDCLKQNQQLELKQNNDQQINYQEIENLNDINQTNESKIEPEFSQNQQSIQEQENNSCIEVEKQLEISEQIQNNDQQVNTNKIENLNDINQTNESKIEPEFSQNQQSIQEQENNSCIEVEKQLEISEQIQNNDQQVNTNKIENLNDINQTNESKIEPEFSQNQQSIQEQENNSCIEVEKQLEISEQIQNNDQQVNTNKIENLNDINQTNESKIEPEFSQNQQSIQEQENNSCIEVEKQLEISEQIQNNDQQVNTNKIENLNDINQTNESKIEPEFSQNQQSIQEQENNSCIEVEKQLEISEQIQNNDQQVNTNKIENLNDINQTNESKIEPEFSQNQQSIQEQENNSCIEVEKQLEISEQIQNNDQQVNTNKIENLNDINQTNESKIEPEFSQNQQSIQEQENNSCIEVEKQLEISEQIQNNDQQVNTNKIENLNDINQTNESKIEPEFSQTQQQQKEQEIKGLKIKSMFLLLKKQEFEEYQLEIQELSNSYQDLNQKIEKFQTIIQKQQTLLKLANQQNLFQSEKNAVDSQTQDLNSQLRNLEEEVNILRKRLIEIQSQLDSLQIRKSNFMDENNKIVQQIEIQNEKIIRLKNSEKLLKEIWKTGQEQIPLYSQLKDWKEINKFSKFSLQDLQKEKLNIEKQRDNFVTELQEKLNSLEIFNKVGTDAVRLKKLQCKLQELNSLNLNNHSCQRVNHKCDQICKVCPDKICDKEAGHSEFQEHLCSLKQHKCNHICEIPECKQSCSLLFDHPKQHNCAGEHPCKQNCQFCSKKCKSDRSMFHQNHQCEDIYCTETCMLCNKKCNQNHSHSQLCSTFCKKQHEHSKQKSNHLCGEQHECKQLCQDKGVCQIIYCQQERTWQSKFKYIQYVPEAHEKKKCCLIIKPGELEHEKNHTCMIETEKQFHICDQRCPECNKFCEKKYNHPGIHSTQIHINKENQVFTAKEGQLGKIEIKDSNVTLRQYQVGDKSTPETCDQSCKRNGRSHYHLVECKGGSECLGKKSDIKARHSDEKYQGFNHLNFDEVLCLDYWNLKKWGHPIPNEISNISQCNYYCPLCKKINGENSFCLKEAWHTQDNKISSHSFHCAQMHKEQTISGIKIAFVIDTTGSMGSYINNCKEIIKSIIQKAKSHKTIDNSEIEMKFAIVSYKDHDPPYNQEQNVVEMCDFTSENDAIKFLNNLTASGGGDTPEAVLDGLYSSSKLNWSGNFQNLLYLIADAPPHGKEYHEFTDSFPEGCPCKKQQNEIFTHLKNAKIQFKIMKLNQSIEGMITKFKQNYPELSIIAPDSKDDVKFQNLIVGDVCDYLTHNEITYQMA
ncbi:unnamed protein product [Paramecium primaurelia]|uniref:VLIG-type G domain-containing protein n=1 Tax=Paramecium primaurelia TaxID=5886 RepID=A0A8S1QB17_PARPR|nr:unnamed protein product [Paramecium primaurelia]